MVRNNKIPMQSKTKESFERIKKKREENDKKHDEIIRIKDYKTEI